MSKVQFTEVFMKKIACILFFFCTISLYAQQNVGDYIEAKCIELEDEYGRRAAGIVFTFIFVTLDDAGLRLTNRMPNNMKSFTNKAIEDTVPMVDALLQDNFDVDTILRLVARQSRLNYQYLVEGYQVYIDRSMYRERNQSPGEN
jgi:hypothetical protein